MCDLLIPALLIAGAALAVGNVGCKTDACAPVCAPACPPQTTYAASYSDMTAPGAMCAPAFTTAPRYDAKVVGFNSRGVPMVNPDNRYGVAPAAAYGY